MNPTPLPPPPPPGSDTPSDAASDPGSSRRTFIAGAGAATVLGAAAVAAVGVATAGSAAADTRPQPDAPPSGDAVVAYLPNPARGEVRLMSGESEVVVHDPALARALTRHLHTGQER